MRSKLGTINTRGPFEAQVAPGQNQYVKGATWDDAWGSRVKIRIPAIHTPTEPKDQDLPWAIVVKPTSSGGLNSQSCGLWGGEWVIAQYIGDQLYIIGTLDKNTSEFDVRGSVNGSTSFQRVDRYNSGLKPAPTQIIGSSEKPTTPVQPTKEEIQEAVKDPEPDPTSQTDTEQEAVTEDPLDFVEFTGDEVPTGESSNQSFGKGLSPDRALQRAENDIGSLIVIPGGVPVNANPTPSQLQQMESNGFTYYPGEQGEGGKFIHKDQNFA